MGSVTSIRQALATALSGQLEIPFVDGRVEGPLERALGCTWPVRKTELEGNADVEQITIGLAVWLKFEQEHDPERRFDPERLEDLGDQVQQHLATVQVGAGGSWYFRWLETSYDVEKQGVSFVVRAYQYSLFDQAT